MNCFKYFRPFLSKVCQQLAHHEFGDLRGLGLGPVLCTFVSQNWNFSSHSLVRLHHGSPLTDTIIIRRTLPSPRPVLTCRKPVVIMHRTPEPKSPDTAPNAKT